MLGYHALKVQISVYISPETKETGLLSWDSDNKQYRQSDCENCHTEAYYDSKTNNQD